jgi:microcystin-dependent protein
MSQPFLGEIKMVGFNFAPRGYAFCSGQTMSIAQNTALFALLGTTYGGNGQSTFALPNLQGRVPIHAGQSPGTSNYVLGQSGGVESVTLNTSNLPAHHHTLSNANAKLGVGAYDGAGNQASPAGHVPAIESTGTSLNYSDQASNASSSLAYGTGAATDLTGSNIPVSTVPPYTCVNFIIALQGIFPSRN